MRGREDGGQRIVSKPAEKFDVIFVFVALIVVLFIVESEHRKLVKRVDALAETLARTLARTRSDLEERVEKLESGAKSAEVGK